LNSFAPIALFVYKRPAHTRRTLEALARNPEVGHSLLHVFCDGPKPDASEADRQAITEVRRIIRERPWCENVEIHESAYNLGLARSIREGVTRILDEHERIIVLEDDIETSPGFLAYMNQALELYADQERVMHIAAYLPVTSYPWLLPRAFFHPMMWCWGWATWRHAWQRARWDAPRLLEDIRRSPSGVHGFDLDGTFPLSEHLMANIAGRMSTWAVFWNASIYLKDGLCLFPSKALAQNTGMDDTGEHCTATDDFCVSLAPAQRLRMQRVKPSILGGFYLRSYFRYGKDSSLSRRLRLALGLCKHRCAVKLRLAR